MPRVKLAGLNIRKNRTGKWYASLRATGKLLATAGDRATLDKIMASPDFLAQYGRAKQEKHTHTYAPGTLGSLIAWYRTKDAYTKLADRTKADYLGAETFLDDVAIYAIAEIEKADVVELRDRAATEKYAKFSDTVIAFLSAVFREAVEAGRMKENPALGVRRLYKPSTDANRRWKDEEWEKVLALAPAHLRVPLAIARWCGLRGQDIVALTWANYRADPEMGMAIAFTPKKNGDKVGEIVIGAPAKLRAVLDPLAKGVLPAAPICRNSVGKRFPTEYAMRKAWQDFKASKAFKVALPDSSDLTLHGLRVTFGSELRERGFSDREVADMLGDLSEIMGKHYSRGAEMRKTSIRVHQRMKNAL
jgi:hypothetical protein